MTEPGREAEFSIDPGSGEPGSGDSGSGDPGRRESAAWRRETRKQLLASRAALSAALHSVYSGQILQRLRTILMEREWKSVGFYWPMAGEVDLSPLIEEALARGMTAALPRVAVAGEPLIFHAWRPESLMEGGLHNTVHPAVLSPASPEVLLIPVVGFDARCYRLGYGGGYYDRMLAAADPRPFTIGVGFEQARLVTIYPRPHDIALDAIVTEASLYTATEQESKLFH